MLTNNLMMLLQPCRLATKNEVSNVVVVVLSYLKIYSLSVFFYYSVLFSGMSLSDMVGVDNPGKKSRFGITYVWHNIYFNFYMISKVQCAESQVVPSVSSVFLNAGVFEREVWESFGVSFCNHQELKRLLTDFNFKGFPLRKDFPLIGFGESFYFDNVKKLRECPTEMSQNYRVFSLLQEWTTKVAAEFGVFHNNEGEVCFIVVSGVYDMWGGAKELENSIYLMIEDNSCFV